MPEVTQIEYKSTLYDIKDVNATAQQYIRPTYQIADCIINGMVDKDYIKVITDKILVRLAEVCC